MKVIATQKGFYGRVVQAGEEFEVDGKAKGSWFKPVNKKAGVKEPHTMGNTVEGEETPSTEGS